MVKADKTGTEEERPFFFFLRYRNDILIFLNTANKIMNTLPSPPPEYVTPYSYYSQYS